MDTAEDFTTLVHTLTKLIITDHKQRKLPKSPTDPLPNFLAKAEEYIIKIIQPYLPSEITNLCAHNNAKNWTTATLETLREHYDRVKEDAIDTIRALLVPDWERAFLVASRWTKRTKDNIKPISFQTAHVILTRIMTPSFPPSNTPHYVHHHQTEENNTDGPRRRKRTPSPTRYQTTAPYSTEDDQDTYMQTKRARTHPQEPMPEDVTGPPTSGDPIEEHADDDPTTTEEETPTVQKQPETTRSIRQIQLTTTHTERNKWDLLPRRPMLILGDMNISRLPHITDHRIQTDAYPGAKIAHAGYLLRHKTTITKQATTVILAFGFEDRTTPNPNLLVKPIENLLSAAKNAFPNARIYIPLINYNNNLPIQTQKTLARINDIIKSQKAFIPQLEKTTFETLPDNIHWTTNTASHMWNHWKSFLE